MSPADDELLERALRDELASDEETSLAARLRAEPPLARRMVELAREESILTEWAAERGATLGAASPSASRWSLRPLVAAAAVLAAGLGLFFLFPRGDGEDRSVRTGPDERRTLRIAEGITIEVRERTSLIIERDAVRLLGGSVEANVPRLPAGKTFAVLAPDGEARVLGTRFEVTAGRGFTRVVVHEGRVFFADLEIPAGHFAIAGGKRIVRSHPFRGTGLLGEYYDAPDLTRPKLARLDPAIDFDWGTGAADPSLPGDAFSVRWSGRLLSRTGGPHTFTTSSDDGARLWVNGQLLIDRFHAQGRKEHAGTIDLAAWQPVDLRMEYLDTDGPAVARLFWSAAGAPREIVPTEALFPPPATGSGLKGEYYDTPNLTDLKLARVDPTVDFAWGLKPPDPSMEAGNYSIRWSGQVEAAHTGTVTFTTVSDDGVRLRVDGQLLIDDWTVRGTAERSGRIDLVAGRRYDLTLEYFQAVSVAGVRLLWGSESQPQQGVPRERLFPAP